MDFFGNGGILQIAFGNLFLEDCIEYKKNLVESNSYELILSLAGINTKQIVQEFIDLGYKAKIVSIRLDKPVLLFLDEIWTKNLWKIHQRMLVHVVSLVNITHSYITETFSLIRYD
ncbi:diphthamide synthase (EF-2-diphthine--ammonia ligase) [Peribacillus sp. V2I11]|nr:diphthamide synthase (EF-2-diphthine--ammonia ligase) [Peribacillus sp. V2I11]